jgi:5'-phosphate synthase pdxT subunit
VTLALGVLGLQGDFAAHARLFRELGQDPRDVRRCRDLDALRALVIPGGESTTLLKLMADEPWFDALSAFHRAGGLLFGTCAGAILLAREVRPAQPSLGLLDAVIERNAYGRQVDSFETELELAGHPTPVRAAFIRAPRFASLGPGAEVLARHEGVPVLVRQDSILAATFHPEITGDPTVHRLFLEMAEGRRETRGPAAQRAAGR